MWKGNEMKHIKLILLTLLATLNLKADSFYLISNV